MTPIPDIWQPIESAPRDGSMVVLTAFEPDGTPFGEEYEMQWMAIQRNGLFPGVTGMWTAPNGAFTWNGSPDTGGPTHWRTP